jgi:hypothetical protein
LLFKSKFFVVVIVFLPVPDGRDKDEERVENGREREPGLREGAVALVHLQQLIVAVLTAAGRD